MTKKTTIRIVAITLIAVIIVAADIVCGLFYNIITPFLNGYGFDTSNVNFENGKQVCEDIESEGIVLLKNEDDVLPLKEKKVNVFGWSSISLAYAGGGSGSSSAVKQAVSLYKALEDAKIEDVDRVEFTVEELVDGGIKTPYYLFVFNNGHTQWTYRIDATDGGIQFADKEDLK